MKATAETIWSVPAYLPYLQPALTNEAVVSAEKQIGYKLPVEYLNLLRKQNGGYIRYSLRESIHEKIAGIGPHFPSLTDFYWEEFQEHVSYPLQGLVPFDGDGHWHLCLDYRKDAANPTITLADVECDSESHVADSFAEYVGMLRIRVGDHDEYILEAVSDIEGLKADLSKHLGVAFDASDTWAHGYQTERAHLGTKRNPQWIWISPNTVPRGFVRMDDPRYESLKDLLPGVGERFPELPFGSYILSATESVKARVIDACKQIGVSVRPLREYLKEE